MKMRRSRRWILLAVCLLAVIGGMLLVFSGLERLILLSDSTAEGNPENVNDSGSIFYDGIWYAPKDSLETILLMGIDMADEGLGQADFLGLLLLDEETEQFLLLHLNRNTIADIFQTDLYGRDAGSFRGQLALAHAYGRDSGDGCRQTVKSVEALLYGITVDHYISLTMDGMSILNDRVGGVTLNLLDDFTHLDPAYTEGSVVTLKGAHALAYVRERGALEDSSDLRRMERQCQYMDALAEAFGKTEDVNSEDFFIDTFLEVNAYMVSDCTADQLGDLTETLHRYEYAGIYMLEGESVKGHTYMEFHLDESSVRQTILKLFYTPVTEK